jgi:hypothetical protein
MKSLARSLGTQVCGRENLARPRTDLIAFIVMRNVNYLREMPQDVNFAIHKRYSKTRVTVATNVFRMRSISVKKQPLFMDENELCL